MKIEVGDIVNTMCSKNVVVVDIKKDGKHDFGCGGDVVFYKHPGYNAPWSTSLEWCTLVKKGEKKMKVYKGIEAHDLMSEGKLMLGQNGFIYKMEDGLIYSCESIEKPWMNCSFNINQFLIMTFTEYKMPLKYKVGDEVWVKAMVIEVDERQGEMPYLLDLGDECREWFNEDEIKGGNE
ncbi:hypothetical protein PDL16_10185 [Bacillus cereus group sp. BY9-3LC]|uniref:hypothetical protein n=1 Tax=Bacillus cereus group sp. BY9-3LC TaxID=3018075 RepID=UPI0022E0B9B3|nr:hypothetical protein [Bacillus cereus group sp. BY9-3LC]MDA1777473.1 hypothetical protein [Bacillus cereus group sp. BY9-3LC]